jgi:CheY-like chemotaxis protein
VPSLGGTIDVESRVGTGTTFRVIIPPGTVEPLVSSGGEPAAASASKRGRILVIDDERLILSVVARMLVPEHDLTCIESAVEALELIADPEGFDLVLCDLMMPGMSGMTFYEELLRSHPGHAHPMVFMTGGTTDSHVDEFLHSIPNPCVRKPFTMVGLRNTMRQQLSRPRAAGG